MKNNIIGQEHWTYKDNVKLFMWEKYCKNNKDFLGTILFVHGSSMPSQPTFDLHVEGRPYSSAMDWFAMRGFDVWCCDMEGYGRSDKSRDINCDINNGANDIKAITDYIEKTRQCGPLLIYGISSGSLRAALFAECYPDRVKRLALDAFVWTGEGSPTLAQRKLNLNNFISNNRRPIDKKFIYSIFERDHPDTADKETIESFADAILKLDNSVPTGTYVDMCSKLPLVDPKKILIPTIIMRGEFDGIAHINDIINFYLLLPNSDKQFVMMPGISHASFQQKNYLLVYDILYGFFSLTEPVYKQRG